MLTGTPRLTKIRHHWLTRWATLSATFCMVAGPLIPNRAVAQPPLRRVNPNAGVRSGEFQALTPDLLKKVQAKKAEDEKRPDVRSLTDREMRVNRGRGAYRNKYFNGVLPWQRKLRDVNLSNGNLFKSFADIQVAPARGAGLALQRTYNSNDDRIGPFGVGWTHAYDIRMQEDPTTSDPNNVPRADFYGGEQKYHRDADGLYSPPPYLFDETSSEYDTFLVSGPAKVLTDTEIGMDGTTKHFVAGAAGTGITNPERVCDYIDDRCGNRISLSYSTVTMPDGSTRKLLYTVTDPSNRTLTFSWTNLGTTMAPAYRITQVTGPLYSVTYSYNTDFNLSSVTLDPSGLNRTTSYTYTTYTGTSGTETGLLSSVTDPLSHSVSYQYSLPSANPTGTLWVSQVTEPGSGGNLVWSITPGSWTYLYIFTTVVSSNDAIAFKVETDQNLRYVATDQGTGQTYKVTYDTATNVTHIEEPVYSSTYPWTSLYPWFYSPIPINARGMNMTYGPHGNMLTSYLDGFTSQVTTMTYYNASQYFMKASVTDPAGHTTTFGIGTKTDSNPGNRGNVLWVRDAGYGVSTSPSYNKQFDYTYNSYGQKTSETNLNGVVTNSTYGDTWGNLTQVVQDPHVTMGDSHLARTTSMQYDVGGRVTQSTDPMGRTSTFTFNSLGQSTQASFPSTSSTSAETVSYSYDGNGRPTSITDNRGTTSISYESTNDCVSSTTDPVTGTISYTYGLAGERLTMSLPGGGTWTYAYRGSTSPDETSTMMPKDDPNSAGRMLSQITDDGSRIVNYRLDLRGRLHETLWNQTFNMSGSLTSLCWTGVYEDQASGYSLTHGRPKTVKNLYLYKNMYGQAFNRVLTQNDYVYDTSGNRTSNQISDQNGVVRTENYGYDEVNRLTSVNYGDSHTQSYTFDAMGNRATKVNDGTSESYTYNAANMLTARGSNSYTNDLNGNTLTGGGRTNTWDSQNRLYQCVTSSSTTINAYASDGLRHRSAVTTGGTTTTTDYVLENTMFIREQKPVSGSQVNVATYLVGARGPEYRRNDSTGVVRWYCYDGLGSVLAEIDGSGNLTASRSYDVYGAVRTSAGTSTSKHKFVGQLGHPSEDDTGLFYMRARYMDPVTGRFISEDPKIHGANWFTYCQNNPVRFVDATGCEPMDWWTGGLCAAGFACAFAAFLVLQTAYIPEGGPMSSLMSVAFAFKLARTAVRLFCASAVGSFSRSHDRIFEFIFAPLIEKLLIPMLEMVNKGSIEPRVSAAVGAAFAYGLVVLGFIVAIDIE